jgi:uncharacterized protein YbaP (TraB family)
MKRIVLLLSSFFSCMAYSQTTQLSNTLLWRISGNGLTKPSYLYGTMHVTDKRVFQLGDSLYYGIEHAEGFAGELDMNMVGTQLLNYIIADKQARKAREAVKVKDAVSHEIWEKYKSQLQEKFYKPADKITVDDLDELESSLENDLVKKGDMPTFLDAYLFGLAKRQGKWVGGLEAIQDQMEHINSESVEQKIQTALFDDHYYRSGIERMIRIYTAQKLDSIDVALYREENGQKDLIMIKRNLKMASMMDSLSLVRSTFFAVGAAHLPGDSGVIALLQKKGFTVTPVFSSKKISADKYTVKSKQIGWLPVSVKDSIYNLEMPGEPGTFEMLQSLGLDMKMFFDISFMKIYMTVGVELSEGRKKIGADSLYSSLKERFFQASGDVKEKHIIVNGIEGREYTGTTDDGEIKLQVFLPSMQVAVINGVFSMSKKTLDDQETIRFFQSFGYNGLPKRSAQAEKRWTSLTSPSLLFSIDMPMKPREVKDVNSREGKILNTYQSVDIKSQVYYGLVVTSVKEGMYQAGSDSSYFESIKLSVKSNIKDARVLDSAFVSFQSYPAYRLSIAGKSEGDSIEAKILSVIRGNRSFYLYTVYSPSHTNRLSAERFIGSFKILPPPASEWKTLLSPDGSFSTRTNIPFKKIQPDEDEPHWDASRVILYDTILASTAYIDKTILPSWFWVSSDTAFFRQKANRYRQYYDDSIKQYHVSNHNDQLVADFVISRPNNRVVKKVKLVINGNELYELFGYFDSADLWESHHRIFDEFAISRRQTPVDRTIPKLTELAQVLENGNADDAKRANLWWSLLPLSTADLPTLQNMLLKLYADFDSTYYDGMNAELFSKVKELDTLNTTVDFLKKKYAAGEIKNEYLKPFIVHYLGHVRTVESYAFLKTIHEGKLPKTKSSYYCLSGLDDSLKLTATLFPTLLKYTGEESTRYYATRLTLELLDSGLINKKMIADNGKPLIGYARNQLTNDKESIERDPESYFDCIRLLGIMNTPESNALLARFAKFDNRGIRFRTLIAQLTNNQPVDQRTIYTMATTDEYRHDLYTEMKKIGKQNLFPVSFLSQQQMAKSKVYNYASTKTMPATIDFSGERTITYKGKQWRFFLYKVYIGDQYLNPHLGVAGPYSLNNKEYISSHEATGIYREKDYDAKDLDNLLNEFLISVGKQENEFVPPPMPPKMK